MQLCDYCLREVIFINANVRTSHFRKTPFIYAAVKWNAAVMRLLNDRGDVDITLVGGHRCCGW